MCLIDGNRFYEVTHICKEAQWLSKPRLLANAIYVIFNRSYFTLFIINYTVDNITFSLQVPKVNTIILGALINKLMEIKSSEYIF